MTNDKFFIRPVAGVDSVIINALLNNHGRKLPINRDFRSNNMFYRSGTYTFPDNNGVDRTGSIYKLKDEYKTGYLQDVSIKIRGNNLKIIVNCFNEKYDKSIYRILVEILFALYMGELIRINAKNRKSLFARLYYIARNFFTAKVDFRFDWNRQQGIPILNKCREVTRYPNKNKNWNTVYLTKPETPKYRPKYRIKLYDKKKDMEFILENHYYPIRLELTIKGFRPQDLKGTAKQVIERDDKDKIQRGFNSVSEYPLFSDFLNCVYWEDLVRGMDRELLREEGESKNQYRYASY